MFETQDDGDVQAQESAESQGLLGEFIAYIKAHKVVILDELAARFGLRTTDVVNRIKSLELTGDITGVLDDRGKYIYVTEEEMSSVVKFIKQKGRVSIDQIKDYCNEAIALNGVTDTDVTSSSSTISTATTSSPSPSDMSSSS